MIHQGPKHYLKFFQPTCFIQILLKITRSGVEDSFKFSNKGVRDPKTLKHSDTHRFFKSFSKTRNQMDILKILLNSHKIHLGPQDFFNFFQKQNAKGSRILLTFFNNKRSGDPHFFKFVLQQNTRVL